MQPRAATEHYAAQTRHLNVALRGIRAIWKRMKGRNWEQTWHSSVGPEMVNLVTAAQETTAAGTDAYMTAVLAELGIPSKVPTQLNIKAFAGVTGEGRSIERELYGGVITAAKAQYRPELAGIKLAPLEDLVLAEAAAYMEEVATSIMADTARAAEAVAMAERPWLTGYVRMIEPGACSRCILLAGKFYLFNEGFQRHPRCRCTHIPYVEDMPHNVLTNPNDYFDSLSPAEQDRIFTPAGAEAVRLGADISQVVNARRGMESVGESKTQRRLINGEAFTVNVKHRRMVPVDVYGRPAYITREGVTRHGVARKAMGSGRPVRLMPESIFAVAHDRADAIRLLKLYGYLTD